MMTEYHCHILPGIDDGAENAEMSLKMAEMMHGQGVRRLTATPHFFAHRERSVEAFLEKRQAAYDKIKGQLPFDSVHLGAEIAIEHGISELPGIEKLAIQGTKLILLELPYGPYGRWMPEEIYNFRAEHHLRVILAHVHRYLEYYSKDEMESILSLRAIMQLNNEVFETWKGRKFAKRLLGEDRMVVFGSDAHNLTSRKPNWDYLQKKVKPDSIEASDAVFDHYLL